MAENPTPRVAIAPADLIAERELEYRNQDGATGMVSVRVARPVQHEPDGAWTCGLHFQGLEEQVMELWGEDSMQALIHAIFLIAPQVQGLRNQGITLTLDGDDDLMLPEFQLGRTRG